MEKKRSRFSRLKKIEKKVERKIKLEEEKVAFKFWKWEVKRRHVFSLATLMFIFALSLRTYNKYVEQGKEPGAVAVIIMFLVSLSIITLLVIRKHRQWGIEHNFRNILRRIELLYYVVTIFVFAFSILHYLIEGYLFPFKEFVFIISISIVFGTITLDTL